jgi:hypothetical protein
MSILYTWLFNNAKGSILVAVVFHAMGNTVTQMFPGSNSNLFYWLVLGLTVVLVVAVYGPRTLARKGRESPQVALRRLSKDQEARNEMQTRHPPLIEIFLRTGYAVFSWDKPGSGESTGKFSD